MRFDLIRACKNCPFVRGEERIRFACRERAQEIEELAYREGFVCHEHAELVEDADGESESYQFRGDGSSQHCFGAIAMYLKSASSGNVPWERATDEDPGLEDRWWRRANRDAIAAVFDDDEEFLKANEGLDD